VIRAMRSMLHGFITLEASGAFGLLADIDRSFQRLIDGFITALEHWTDQTHQPDSRMNASSPLRAPRSEPVLAPV